MVWTRRQVTTYQLEKVPLDDEQKVGILDISKVCIMIPGYVLPYEVGSWCYSKRKKLNHLNYIKGISQYQTLSSSLNKNRKKTIKKYIEYLLFHIKTGKSIHSLKTAISQFQQFVTWCDRNYIKGLDGKEEFIKAVEMYTHQLIDEIRQSTRNINTAAALQNIVLTAGKGMYGDPYGDLFRYIKKISKSNAATNITEKPEDEKAKKAINMYQSVFDQLRNFVLDFEAFPKKIEFEHGYFWFFPTSLPFAGPSNADKKQALDTSFMCYDFINGCLRKTHEVKAMSKSSYSGEAKKAIERAKYNIETANKSRCHKRRINAATLASQAFMMMFSANTGMNLSQMASLPSINDFDTHKSKQGFKAIKYRANGKEVEFFVTSRFVFELEKFLNLRKYILQCIGLNDYDYLFFRVYKNKAFQLQQTFVTHFHDRLETCFDFDIKITTRMWRSYKSDWLIKNSDMKTASILMQNTPETILKHYSEGSDSEATKEVNSFFTKYSNSLILQKNQTATPTASGNCIAQNPIPINPKVIIHPNCTQPEGCLFCKSYKVHADETDLRKLLSFKYVLQISKPLTQGDQHFRFILAPIIERIDEILQELTNLADLSADEVKKIKNEVSEQEVLSTYWSRKLDLLDSLGVI